MQRTNARLDALSLVRFDFDFVTYRKVEQAAPHVRRKAVHLCEPVDAGRREVGQNVQQLKAHGLGNHW